jgi:effector-binding domain-containing protein
MKALLKILYFFLILLFIFLLVGIFFPKSVHIESSIQINASPEIVFEQVNTLKNWDNWSPWQNSDSTMDISYNNVTSGIGASYIWTSKSSGKGKITIADSRPLNYVQVDLDFGTNGKALSSWKFKKEAKGTFVSWSFDNNKLKYFERYFIVFFKKNMLTTFKEGLEKLKESSEELRLNRISEIIETDLPQRNALIIIDSSTIQDFDQKMANTFGKLMNYLDRRNIGPTDKPFIIFLKMNRQGLNKFAFGFPIAEKTWSWQEYQFNRMDSCKAIMVKHWGKYGSDKPFKALDNYLIEKNLLLDGYPWEVYINGPKTEPDTSQWLTEIYYPVKLK